MNSYKFQVQAPVALLKQWLKANGCPKAAKSVKQHGANGSSFIVEGNVSAASIVSAFESCRFEYQVEPTLGSEPLPRIWVIA
jgi:hypothetical protein